MSHKLHYLQVHSSFDYGDGSWENATPADRTTLTLNLIRDSYAWRLRQIEQSLKLKDFGEINIRTIMQAIINRKPIADKHLEETGNGFGIPNTRLQNLRQE